MAFLKKHSLYFAWLFTIAGMLFSLVLSGVYQWPICHLCWYQRICLYPLVVILGIACYRGDKGIATYTLPLAALGFIFSLYQYLEQMIPGFAPINVCGQGPSCSDIHMQLFGFITLPFVSILGFSFLAFLLFLSRKN